MNLPGRSPLAAALVILALTIFGVLMSVYPIASFNTQSADKPIIPVWELGDAEQTAEQTEEDDTSISTLSSSPAQSETSGATEEIAVDPWASEVVEAALREPFAQGPKEADEAAESNNLPRAASDNPAARPADPVLPKVESPSSEDTITPSQEDPALTSTAQYPDTEVAAQSLPPQASPPDSPTGTEASAQPSLTLPADMGTSWHLPPDSSADTEAFPQPSAPPDETIPSSWSTDSPPLRGDI